MLFLELREFVLLVLTDLLEPLNGVLLLLNGDLIELLNDDLPLLRLCVEDFRCTMYSQTTLFLLNRAYDFVSSINKTVIKNLKH